MKISIIAIGQHMPDWVDHGYQEYAKRLSREMCPQLIEIPLPKRTKNSDINRLLQQEGELMLGAIPSSADIIALDEHGQQSTTVELAQQLDRWRQHGQNPCFLIGGPDGLASACLAKTKQVWSLSKLTLPHPIVRIILIEQLYRALSILNRHPYHRG